MFPLIFSLLNLNNMRKTSTLYFGQSESVIDENFNPKLVVLKGKIQDKSS